MEDPVDRNLRTARDVIARLQHDHPIVRSNMAAGNVSNLSFGTIADPSGAVDWTTVEAAGNARIALGVTRYQMLIEHALVNLLEADLMRGLNVVANTAPDANRYRCDGGTGDWADPSCERLAVRNTWIDGVHHDLCDACRQRYYRTLKAGATNVTKPVVTSSLNPAMRRPLSPGND